MRNETDYLKRKTESQCMDPALNRPFLANDFAWLSKNRYDRWHPNSDEVGHAVVRIKPDGTEIAEQYDIPQAEPSEDSLEDSEPAPRVRHLMRIEAVQQANDSNGEAILYYRAVTQEGRPMVGRRSNRIEIANTETGDVEAARVIYFSPERKNDYLGTTEKIPLFKEGLSKEQLALKQKLEAVGTRTKGGRNIFVDPNAVKLRVEMDRARSQTQVMGRSAVDEQARFLTSEMTSILHPEMEKKLRQAIEADLNDAVTFHRKPEWAHVYAFVLMLSTENPQVRENLVAAPRWFNTAMLVLECTAVWFSLNRPQALVHMQGIFETLMNSHILANAEYEISVEEKSRCIRLFERYDLSLKSEMFRRPSDLAQMSAITYSLLGHALPISTYAVKGEIIGLPLPVINAITFVPKSVMDAAKEKAVKTSEIPETEPASFDVKKNLLFAHVVSRGQKLSFMQAIPMGVSRLLKKIF